VKLKVFIETRAPHRIVGFGLMPVAGPAEEDAPLSPSEIAARLEDFLTRMAEADAFSGAALLARRGEPVFRRAYGLANRDFGAPNAVDTKFNLGSLNKMFTAVAVAQLVERGRLSFADPLAKFLPAFPDEASARKIRIEHLLTHTAGLGSYFTPRFTKSSRALLRSVDDMMALAAADETPLFEPGTSWRYSNTGFLALGKVVECVTGSSYHDVVRENVCAPARMENTECYELDRVNPNLALGYDKVHTDEGAHHHRNNLFDHVIRGGPHGGGYSTVDDLSAFARALRDGTLASVGTAASLLSAKPHLGSPRYGFGFAADAESGIAGHSGGFLGVGANLDMFLDSGWTGVVLSNYTGGALAVAMRMRELARSARP
jgi:CubicO group peptidase (beta-lactamase class C family)